MKVIIAGSRSINDLDAVFVAMRRSGFKVTEVVSGRARGVDRLGEKWAKRLRIPVKPFPAAWRDKDGAFNPGAGALRNRLMATYAEALVAIMEPEGTPGTLDMIDAARKAGIPVYIHDYLGDDL